MSYACDICDATLATVVHARTPSTPRIRWVARWDGNTFIRSYRCKEHLPDATH